MNDFATIPDMYEKSDRSMTVEVNDDGEAVFTAYDNEDFRSTSVHVSPRDAKIIATMLTRWAEEQGQ